MGGLLKSLQYQYIISNEIRKLSPKEEELKLYAELDKPSHEQN